MPNVRIHKAQANPGKHPVRSLSIIADEAIPSHQFSEGGLREFFTQEAAIVVEAMEKHLPQGLVDAILAELLRVKASTLVIPKEGNHVQSN